MPVYNTGRYVGEAIQSILMQKFTDFEFIIINDGSTDNSLSVISSFKDKRIKLINICANSGNYFARNKGYEIARGKYICAMDSDDVSTLNRLEIQFKYMEDHPDVGLSGGGFRILGREEDIFFRETEYENIKVMLLRSFCFYHTPLIFRHSFLKKYDLRYNEKYRLAADYDLAVRCAKYFTVTNIPEDLFHYRIHDEQISWKFRSDQMTVIDKLRLEQLNFIGIIPDASEMNLHLSLLNRIPIEFKQKDNTRNWIDKILSANRMKKYYHPDKLELLFKALLTEQPFQNGREEKYLPFKEVNEGGTKYYLNDVTFLLILRIDSQELIENINTVVKYLTNHFNTTIKILEVGEIQHYLPVFESNEVMYEFVADNSRMLNKNKWINFMLPEVHTPFFSVWDIDIIVSRGQVIEGIENLRSGNSVMNLPYDGRICYCDKLMSNIFRQTLSIDQLQKYESAFELYEGWNSHGAVFFAEKKRYLKTGIENERIFNLKIAEEDRVKRLEVSDLLISRVTGPVYKLWHPGMKRHIKPSIETEINDRKEFLKTCSTVH